MDASSTKRIKLSPSEEDEEKIDPFTFDRLLETGKILYKCTELPPELIHLTLPYVELELVERPVAFPVTCYLNNDVLILSGGLSMICVRKSCCVDLIRIQDMAYLGHAFLPFAYHFEHPAWLQLDKDHVVFFLNGKYCLWNFTLGTMSPALPTLLDGKDPIFVMHVERVPSHGNQVFARRTPSTMEVLVVTISVEGDKAISVEGEKLKFHQTKRTLAHAILSAPLILGDKYMFEEDCPEYYCELEPKTTMQTWKRKDDFPSGSRRWINGRDDTYILTFPGVIQGWDASESKWQWSCCLSRLLLNDMTFEIDSLSDSQLLVWSRHQTGPLAIISKVTGNAVYIEREPGFQVITCHDNTLIGRIGDDFQAIRFW
jgi:hypothetical protein